MPVSETPERPIRRDRALLLLAGVGAAGLLAWKVRDAHLRARARQAPSLSPLPSPARDERVLVIAPHPDDETLALGGLIHQSVRRGSEVRLVFLTSGDGFSLCAGLRYRAWPGPGLMRRLSAERHTEAVQAAAALGLQPEDLLFLGYPDRGLAPLWLEHWSPAAPYRSPYSGLSAVPEDGSLSPGTPYSGESLLRDLERLVAEYAPHRVYYPDSLDDHPDHWAAHCFVEMALSRLPASTMPHSRTYLVHRGQWPLPFGKDVNLYLAPPAETATLPVTWETVPLDAAALAAKTTALEAHTSQHPLVGRFLRAFLRRNELFARWRKPFGLPDGAAWRFPDARHDRPARRLCGGLDFTALEVTRLAGDLLIRARLRGAPVPWATYTLCWKPLQGPVEQCHTRSSSCRGGEAALETRVPAGEAPSGEVLVAAFVESGPVLLDRTPWYHVATATC